MAYPDDELDLTSTAYPSDETYDADEAYDESSFEDDSDELYEAVDESIQDFDAPADEAADSEEGASGDTAVSEAIQTVGRGAVDAATDASRTIAGGFTAMRAVRKLSKQRQDAQLDLREIELGLEEDRNTLVHREDIERNYEQIVADETAAQEEARAEAEQLEATIREQQESLSKLSDGLRRMKESHEQKLRPYRNLMDSSRGRSDDAAKALAASKRAVRNAERTMSDATRNRDQRIAAAHRAVDNAQERVSTLQAEQQDALAGADETTLERVSTELASEYAHLESVRADVASVTHEAQADVETAQQNLLRLQRELSAAERTAAEAKEEATARKDEYDGLYKQAQGKEKIREDAIRAAEERIRGLKQSLSAAKARMNDAQDALDEAMEIHAHPEVTAGLRERIADEEADLEAARAELDDLVATERELRRTTRGSRVVFVVVAILIVALIAVLVWFLCFRKA